MLQNKIPVLMSGLGKLGTEIFPALIEDDDFAVLGCVLESDAVAEDYRPVGDYHPRLIKQKNWEKDLDILKRAHPGLIIVEATCPDSVNANVETFCRHGIPSLICTTGGDRGLLEATINSSEVPAVIAPNLAAPIIWILESLAQGALMAPGLLNGWTVKKVESHQTGKKDFSGTADQFGKRVFTTLGAKDVDVKDYVKITDEHLKETRSLPALLEASGSANIALRGKTVQKLWGVPEQHLGGHGYHEYTLRSPDGTTEIMIGHKVNGRAPYIPGAIQALKFLHQARIAGAKGAFFMRDVIFNQ